MFEAETVRVMGSSLPARLTWEPRVGDVVTTTGRSSMLSGLGSMRE